jgi:hypothetical protein
MKLLNNVITVIALVGVTYAAFFSVMMTLMIALPEPYKGLSVPAGLIVAAAVPCAAGWFV